MRLRSELDEWRQRIPNTPISPALPHIESDQVYAVYLQAVLNLMKAVLAQPTMDHNLLHQCAIFASDGCQVSELSI
jgi:hypothetical protein